MEERKRRQEITAKNKELKRIKKVKKEKNDPKNYAPRSKN